MKRLLTFVLMFMVASVLLVGISFGAGDERFIFSNLIVKDKETGVIWTKEANIADREMIWDDASKFVKKLNKQKYAGYSDWRLPTEEELDTLRSYAISQGHITYIDVFFSKIGFKNVQAGYYWSSTPAFMGDTRHAMTFGMRNGVVTPSDKALTGMCGQYVLDSRLFGDLIFFLRDT